ncbi:hypothetical protein JZ751_004958, partial [Albula glossodonta]
MRTVTNWCDDEETISVRRTESSDAREINDLITPATEAVFGRVNVIYLLEKANLAVTVTNSKNEVLAHAAFLDHPSTYLVDPAGWEPWLHKHFSSDKCTPLNTLFLHLFVAQPDLSLGCAKEIARVEDHDDLTHLLAEQAKVCSASYGPYFLAELIDAQNDDFHAAVCETPLANPTGSAETESPEESSNATCEDPEEKDPKSVPEPGQNVPNAFCIQLFFIDKKYEMRSVDFLPYIFKLFPDRDFCVISVPKLGPEFPLLQTFLRAVPQSSSTLPHELYIYHRSGLLKTFEVRVTVSSDRHAIESLLKKLSLHESMLEDLDKFYQARQNKDGTPMQVFVAQVVEQVVGILIIKNEEDIDYIRAHYNIENFIYFSHHQREEHGQLCHFALNPIFHHYAKHFLKEALRLSHKSCLYYLIYPSYLTQKLTIPPPFPQNASAHSLTSALSCMVPVRPRRQIIYPLEELGLNAPSRQVTADQTPYALNHINRKLTMEPKATVNIRIVVVGASDTGISFLEVLAFCPHLRFNNLTLISKHGLPSYCNNEKTSFLATSHSYTDRDYAQLSLRSWVNVIEGKMMGINRADKHVLVSGDRKIPCPSGVDISQPITNSELPVQAEQRYTGAIPSNLLTLNDDHDCQRAHSWLLENFVDLEGDVVIYGNTIDIFTCVEKLLSMGVAGSRIKVVHPPTDSQLTCFSSPAVEEAVRAALRRSEVQVHQDSLLAQLNDGQDPEPLSSVSFTTEKQPIRLKCAVFINFFRKGVDYNAFKSINDACLVYDGRLVIDSNFHTNDSTIRAAGPLTKFARSYHADQWSHASFNSKEVGTELARALLPFFDPTLESETNPSATEDQLIPLYSQAKIQGQVHIQAHLHHCNISIKYEFNCSLHRLVPLFKMMVQTSNNAKWCTHSKNIKMIVGREIGTGKVEEGNYFRLFLNQYGLVESITCLSKEPFPVSNYLCLYGRHELLLNRLCTRFDEGLVTDLYRYDTEHLTG